MDVIILEQSMEVYNKVNDATSLIAQGNNESGMKIITELFNANKVIVQSLGDQSSTGQPQVAT